MVKRVHKERNVYPQNSDGSIQTDIEAKLNWISVDGEAGDMIFFDSYVPHRSDINNSDFTRRNLYLTYNPISLGSFRERYYEEKRIAFPPECERDPNKDYRLSATCLENIKHSFTNGALRNRELKKSSLYCNLRYEFCQHYCQFFCSY